MEDANKWHKFLEEADKKLLRDLERQRILTDNLAPEDEAFQNQTRLDKESRLQELNECDVIAKKSCQHLLKVQVAKTNASKDNFHSCYICLGCGKEAEHQEDINMQGTIDLLAIFKRQAILHDKDEELDLFINLNPLLHRVLDNENICGLPENAVASRIIEELTINKDVSLGK